MIPSYAVPAGDSQCVNLGVNGAGQQSVLQVQ